MNNAVHTGKKQTIDVVKYKNDPLMHRNTEIWRFYFNDNWTLRDIARYFNLETSEVRNILAMHKKYFQQEYD